MINLQIFSSGETSKTQDSSNCSVGKGTSDSGPQSTRLIYLNERKQEKTEFKPKPKKMQRGMTFIGWYERVNCLSVQLFCCYFSYYTNIVYTFLALFSLIFLLICCGFTVYRKNSKRCDQSSHLHAIPKLFTNSMLSFDNISIGLTSQLNFGIPPNRIITTTSTILIILLFLSVLFFF